MRGDAGRRLRLENVHIELDALEVDPVAGGVAGDQRGSGITAFAELFPQLEDAVSDVCDGRRAAFRPQRVRDRLRALGAFARCEQIPEHLARPLLEPVAVARAPLHAHRQAAERRHADVALRRRHAAGAVVELQLERDHLLRARADRARRDGSAQRAAFRARRPRTGRQPVRRRERLLGKASMRLARVDGAVQRVATPHAARPLQPRPLEPGIQLGTRPDDPPAGVDQHHAAASAPIAHWLASLVISHLDHPVVRLTRHSNLAAIRSMCCRLHVSN